MRKKGRKYLMPISDRVRKSMQNGSWIRRMFEEGTLSKETGIKFTEKDIVMTSGAAGALNVVLKTLMNRGDEVIIFAPYFAEFINYIENHDGVARVLPTDVRFIP